MTVTVHAIKFFNPKYAEYSPLRILPNKASPYSFHSMIYETACKKCFAAHQRRNEHYLVCFWELSCNIQISCSETTANNMRKKGKPNPDQR